MTKHQRGATMAGLAIGFAFFLIRLAASRSFGDLLLALAFLVAECGVVCLLKGVAHRTEPAIEYTNSHNKAVDQAEQGVQSAREDLARRQALLDEIDAAVATAEKEFDLDLELGDPKILAAIATKAVRSGYLAGIAANLGEIGGVPPTEAV